MNSCLARVMLVATLLSVFGCRRGHRALPRVRHAEPRYVFIDGGANIGQTILAFEASKLFTKHPWSVVSFEPNPDLFAQLPRRPFVSLRQEAIWTRDETLTFHISPAQPLAGTLMPQVALTEPRAVQVTAIDFGQWLRQTYRKEDVVYVKFDIEGAEYPVLEQMLHDGSMAWVDRLYIEFHGVQQATDAKKSDWEVYLAHKRDHELVQAITGLGVAVSLHLTHEVQGTYFDFNPEKWGQAW